MGPHLGKARDFGEAARGVYGQNGSAELQCSEGTQVNYPSVCVSAALNYPVPAWQLIGVEWKSDNNSEDESVQEWQKGLWPLSGAQAHLWWVVLTSDKTKTVGGDPGTPITLLHLDPERHLSLNEVPLEEQIWGLRRLWKAQRALFPLPWSGGAPCLVAASCPSAWPHWQDSLEHPPAGNMSGKGFQPGIQRHWFCIDPAAFSALLLGTGRSTPRADQYSIPANTSKLACRASSFWSASGVFWDVSQQEAQISSCPLQEVLKLSLF